MVAFARAISFVTTFVSSREIMGYDLQYLCDIVQRTCFEKFSANLDNVNKNRIHLKKWDLFMIDERWTDVNMILWYVYERTNTMQRVTLG